jgi:hypothetical protein
VSAPKTEPPTVIVAATAPSRVAVQVEASRGTDWRVRELEDAELRSWLSFA